MPVYLNALLMLAATVAAFLVLAKLAGHLRAGRVPAGWRGRLRAPAADSLVRVEEACVVDAKRRLLALRCGGTRVFLLTGGPVDLVVSQAPLLPTAGGERA